MKHSVLLSFSVALLLHTSCSSSKNVASEVNADTNTIATSDYRFQSARLDSAISFMSIQLDSFVINAEPVLLNPCHSEDTTRSAVVAYRYNIKANSASVKAKSNAVSRSVADTLQRDSTAVLHSYSSARNEASNSSAVYKPPDCWSFTFVIILLALIAFGIFRYLRK